MRSSIQERGRAADTLLGAELLQPTTGGEEAR
jgi:hypothetical protein